MGKHAYLIMAHNQFNLLEKLLECLDDQRNDFFLHIDKKSKCDLEQIKKKIKKGKIYFTSRINVVWGGYSQIRAEMMLLKDATNKGEYDYYHLITGVDFPLKSQSEILNYFDSMNGMNFISLNNGPVPQKFLNRVKFYYPLQDHIKARNSLISQAIRKIIISSQKVIHINRVNDQMKLGFGSAYFDITDDFARYVVTQENYVRKHFKCTFCADEMFIQTLWLGWDKNGEKRRYYYQGERNPFISNTFLDVNRAINFSRGSGGAPYTYKITDYDMLIESGCLFARKFNYEEYPEIVDQLFNHILEE